MFLVKDPGLLLSHSIKQAPWQMILGTTPEDSGQQPLQIKYPKNISHEVHRSEEGGAFLASCYQEINAPAVRDHERLTSGTEHQFPVHALPVLGALER